MHENGVTSNGFTAYSVTSLLSNVDFVPCELNEHHHASQMNIVPLNLHVLFNLRCSFFHPAPSSACCLFCRKKLMSSCVAAVREQRLAPLTSAEGDEPLINGYGFALMGF